MIHSSETRVSVLEYRMNIKWRDKRCNIFILVSVDVLPPLAGKSQESIRTVFIHTRHSDTRCRRATISRNVRERALKWVGIDNSHTRAFPRVFERKHCWTVNFPISFSAKPRYNTVCSTIAAPRYRGSIQGDIQIE